MTSLAKELAVAGENPTVQFPVETVRQHAATVDLVADAVEVARSAVHQVTMDSQAYGQLCQFMPAMLGPVFGLAVEALYESVGSLQETASNLKTAAATTQETDLGSQRRLLATGGQQQGPLLELPL